MAAILAWAAIGIGLEWNPPPCPECLQLDDWYLSQLCPAQVSFFPEMHDNSWKVPFTAQSQFVGSSTLNSGAVKENLEVPQIEPAIGTAFMATKCCHLEESSLSPILGLQVYFVPRRKGITVLPDRLPPPRMPRLSCRSIR